MNRLDFILASRIAKPKLLDYRTQEYIKWCDKELTLRYKDSRQYFEDRYVGKFGTMQSLFMEEEVRREYDERGKLKCQD